MGIDTVTWRLDAECAAFDTVANPTRINIPTQTASSAWMIPTDEIMHYGDANATVELGLPSTIDSGALQYVKLAFVTLTLVNGGSAARVSATSYYDNSGSTARAKSQYFTLSADRPRAVMILPGDSTGLTPVQPDTTTRRVFVLEAGDDVRIRALTLLSAG